MTHGDADENDNVLACASTAAIAEHGQASRAIWILGASGRAGRVIAAELGGSRPPCAWREGRPGAFTPGALLPDRSSPWRRADSSFSNPRSPAR